MNKAGPNSRLLVPPLYFLVALLLMVFFHRVVPWAHILEAPYRYAGLVLAGLALGLIAGAAALLRPARAAPRPRRPAALPERVGGGALSPRRHQHPAVHALERAGRRRSLQVHAQ